MHSRIRQFAVLIAVQVWTATGCAAGHNDPAETSVAQAAGQNAVEPNATVLKLQRALEDCDEGILRTTNSLVYRSGAAKEALGALVSAWNTSTESTRCGDNRRIRAFIAEALAQGHANGIVRLVDVQSVRSALRDGIQSEDLETASASISGLVAIAESADFRKLEDLASSELSVARTEVVHALATQCLEESRAILQRLESKFEAGYVERVRQDMAQVRDANCKRGIG